MVLAVVLGLGAFVPAVSEGAGVVVVAQARDGRLYVRRGEALRPLFVKGVNMGVALPGRFPAEFPQDEETYRTLLTDAAEMGVNTVRLYTLLPPAFYDAFRRHNEEAAGKPLWLLQGVWTEPPGRDDYDDAAFQRGFRDEIHHVIDAVHGRLVLAARAGHAAGVYRSDISESVLGYILGREWEPQSVAAYDARAGARRSFPGRYVTARPQDGATPFEQWLAKTLDDAVAYETDTYRQQRPFSFVNWPTLDPLRHPTESSAREEARLLRNRGEEESAAMTEDYSECEDCVSVDATHIVATRRAAGGLFATYHAYPYYPDFMNLDPGYLQARDSQGPSNYIGYLRELRKHHDRQPVLIGETGVPSSRGVAHLQPQGWHHGGHDEREQGEIDARLMRDIDEAHLAGGVLFALVDEWFKRNWLVSPFEVPAERKPLWLNVLDPEENYGVVAARPGAGGWKVTIDGRVDDWRGVPVLLRQPPGGPERPLQDGHDAARTLRGLSVASDEAYLYIRLDVERLDADGDGAADWSDAAYLIGIDTRDTARGDHRAPITDDIVTPVGIEFWVVLDGPGSSRLLVDAPYDTRARRRPYGSVDNSDGRFVEMVAETNRRRIGRDGTVFPAQRSSRSPLRRGSMNPADPDATTLTDWREGVAANSIEVRIPWGLLNVTDPSSRCVLQDRPDDRSGVGCVETPGFRFLVLAVKPDVPPGGLAADGRPMAARLADRLPRGDRTAPGDWPLYSWAPWDRPTFHLERKESWKILQEVLPRLPASGEGR